MDAHLHGHAHAHGAHHGHHGHGHSPVPARFDRALAIGTALNAAFVIVETVDGLASHPLALLARITRDLRHRFGGEPATLQVEVGLHDHGCDVAPHGPRPATRIASAVR